MKVEVLVPDTPLPAAAPPARPLGAPTPGGDGFAGALAGAVDAIATRLRRADRAENAVIDGRGSIQSAAIARAEADVEVTVAAAIVSQAARALNAVSQMQV